MFGFFATPSPPFHSHLASTSPSTLPPHRHSQPSPQQISKIGLRQKKAHMMEIQINGGSTSDKVDFGKNLFESEVPVDTVFSKDENIDVLGATKGHGKGTMR